jgi:hypothetical protein
MLDRTDTNKAISEHWDSKAETLTIVLDRSKMLMVAQEGGATSWTDKEGKEYFFFPEYRHEASGIYISRNGAIGVSVELPSVIKVPETTKAILDKLPPELRDAVLKSLSK